MAQYRPKHALVVRDTAPISPLDAPGAEMWLLGSSLYDRMARVLARAGLEVSRVDSLDQAVQRAAELPDGALVTYDSMAYSRSVIRHLLAAAADKPAVCAALPRGNAVTTLAHISGLEPIELDGSPAFTAPLWVLRGGAKPEQAIATLLPYKEAQWELPIPAGMMGSAAEPFAVTDTYMVRVDHWAHVLRLNITALVAEWVERSQSLTGKLWFLWRALLGFPWRRGRLGGAIHRIHRGAKIHHTALVEYSFIEDGAVIGANAIVRGSYIARGARIDDGAIVNASVVGPEAFVSNASGILCCVLFPGAFAAQQKMQFTVLGPSSVAFTGSNFYDLNFHKNVWVRHRGKVVDGGSRFLGVCMGPWSRVAGGVWAASGREIPSGALIVQPPDQVLHKADVELAQSKITTVSNKQLVEVAELPKR